MLYVAMILVSLVLSGYSTYSWQRKGFFLTSPAGLCAVLWSIIWLIHLLDIFEFFQVSAKAQVFSFIPVISIFIGEELGKRITGHRKPSYLNVRRVVSLLRLDVALVVLFSAISLISVYFIFGNPLSEGTGALIKAARSEYGVRMLEGSPLFIISQYFVISRAFLYAALFALVPLWTIDAKKAGRLTLVCVACAVVADVSWGSRTLILDILIMTLIWVSIVYPKTRLRTRMIRRIALWMVVIGVMAGLFIGAQEITATTRDAKSTEIQGIEVPYSVAHLVKYYSQTLVTFDQTENNNEVRTYGLMSFGGVLNILHLFRLYRNDDLEVYEIMYDWELENPNYSEGAYNRGNIYSWLRYFYADFGLIGLFAMPAIVGFLSGKSMRTLATSAGHKYFAYVGITVSFYLVARSPIIFSLRHDYVVLGIIFAILIGSIGSSRVGKKGPLASNAA